MTDLHPSPTKTSLSFPLTSLTVLDPISPLTQNRGLHYLTEPIVGVGAVYVKLTQGQVDSVSEVGRDS